MSSGKKKVKQNINSTLFMKMVGPNSPFPSCLKRGMVHNHSYENEFNLHVNEISFSYEKVGTKTRFEKEAEGNSEMAYCPPTNTEVLPVIL